jgi:hypothetical protein
MQLMAKLLLPYSPRFQNVGAVASSFCPNYGYHASAYGSISKLLRDITDCSRRTQEVV